MYKRVARAIPMNSKEGGKMAGSVGKYQFRSKEDPRYIDRRMQSLLRKIEDNFDKYNMESVSTICKP